jgi:L-alanine-DL-glutamate epimerase-like enolase superfamily enzyme
MMVDVNQKLDVLSNIRQARMLEDFDLVWYEEPVIADDNAACAEVAHAINIPVATGENHYTRYEFRDLIERKARALPDARRLPRERLQRDAAHRAPRRSARRPGFAARGLRDLDPGRRRALERLPRRVDGLDAAGPVRRAAPVPRRRHPHPDRPGHGLALAKGAIEKYAK